MANVSEEPLWPRAGLGTKSQEHAEGEALQMTQDMALRLAGRAAVVAGGAAYIGRATSLAFSREGVPLAMVDINKRRA